MKTTSPLLEGGLVGCVCSRWSEKPGLGGLHLKVAARWILANERRVADDRVGPSNSGLGERLVGTPLFCFLPSRPRVRALLQKRCCRCKGIERFESMGADFKVSHYRQACRVERLSVRLSIVACREVSYSMWHGVKDDPRMMDGRGNKPTTQDQPNEKKVLTSELRKAISQFKLRKPSRCNCIVPSKNNGRLKGIGSRVVVS